MIRFIYGNHGYGKTDRILNMIKNDTQNGTHTFLIVPDQEALQAERLTLEKLPSSSQLELEVLSFSRLYNRVCREYGNLCYSYVTKPIRYLLMWKTIRELKGNLEVLGSATKKDIALEDLLISSINELKINAITPKMLEDAAESLKNSAPDLSAKMSDLAAIYTCFDMHVNEKFSDSADDLSRLCDVLDKHSFFRGASVYIDSFTSFTPVQHKIIEKIFKSAENVTVTIPADKSNLSEMDFKSIKISEGKLIASARSVSEPVIECLKKPESQKSEALEYVSENLWRLNVSKDSKTDFSDGSIVLEECDTPYSEAQAVSAHIRALLANGARCRDIVIIARDAENYRGIIDQALTRSDIPFYFSNSFDLYSTAAVKFIISALQIKIYNWRKSDVIAHIKSGLCNISLTDAYLFEEYINTWNINGSDFFIDEWTMNPDGFQAGELSPRAKAILAAANRVRKSIVPVLEKLFICLNAEETVGGMCKALYSFLLESELEKRLLEISKKANESGDKKAAQENLRIYGIIINSLADIGSALDDEKASTEELIVILKSVFNKTEINTIPTSVDEVTIGSANMLRTSNPKYAFVLGLCEGKFPASIKNDGVFSNADKAILNESGIEFDATSETRASDELMYVKRSFSAPTSRLYAFTHVSEINGSKCFKSLAFSRLEALLGIKAHKYSETDFSYLIPAPKNAAMGLRSISDKSKSATLRKALVPYVDGIEYRSLQSIKTSSAQTSKNPIDSALSASSFETYAKCPFNHFCKYTLKLREKKTARFGADNIGTFIHAVLETVISELVPESTNENPITDEELIKITDEAVKKYLESVCPPQLTISKRLRHLYVKLQKLSLLLARNIIKEFSDSDFYPAAFELRVNSKDGVIAPLTFTLTSGTKIQFNGIIDRVDLYKKNNNVYVRVVDYKTGAKEFNLKELTQGLNTQMLLYLYSICKNGSSFIADSTKINTVDKIIPSGVVYLSSNISSLKRTDYEEAAIIEADAEKELSRTGLLIDEKDVLLAMNHSVNSKYLLGAKLTSKNDIKGSSLISEQKFTEIFNDLENVIIKIADKLESGNIDAIPITSKNSPCEYCTSKPICRNVQK